MKKTTYLISILFFMTIVANSCDHDENILSSHAKSSETILESSKINYARVENPIALEGNIKVWKSTSNELVIFTETEELKHLFILQDMYNETIFQDEYFKLTFLDHGVVLDSKTNESLFVGVKDKTESLNIKKAFDENRKSKKMNDTYGTGLIHIWQPSKSKIADSKMKYNLLTEQPSVLKFIYEDAATESCDNGGAGSSSCSVSTGGSGSNSGCSVSCQTGYYSCCNRGSLFTSQSCSCIKIKSKNQSIN